MQESDDLPERESKTQRKKQMLALQKIGEALVNLPGPELAKIPLDTRLGDAIDVARALTSHEAKRRQLQYIGKLMREAELEPIQEALDKVQMKGQLSKAKFHQVERWRDKLIAEGDEVLHDFLQKYPSVDNQQLRQLVRNAKKIEQGVKTAGSETALFRFLHRTINEVN